jgi:hypothetical protein
VRSEYRNLVVLVTGDGFGITKMLKYGDNCYAANRDKPYRDGWGFICGPEPGNQETLQVPPSGTDSYSTPSTADNVSPANTGTSIPPTSTHPGRFNIGASACSSSSSSSIDNLWDVTRHDGTTLEGMQWFQADKETFRVFQDSSSTYHLNWREKPPPRFFFS